MCAPHPILLRTRLNALGIATTPTPPSRDRQGATLSPTQHSALSPQHSTLRANGNLLKAYTYDGFGRRLAESVVDAMGYLITSQKVYSTRWQLLAEGVTAATPKVKYVWSPVYVNALIARDEDVNLDGTRDRRVYAAQDLSWNTTTVVESDGVVNQHKIYRPYGFYITTDKNWSYFYDDPIGWNITYKGGIEDQSTNTVNFDNRDYNLHTFTWNTEDPLRFVDGLNDRTFVADNPINSTDPSGLAAWKHTSWWDASWKQKLRDYVQQHAIDYVNSPLDCAELSIKVLVDFAATNGLPVTLWSADGHIFVSKSCKWSTKDQFFNAVIGRHGVHSNEIFNKNTTADIPDDQIQAGDIGTKIGHALLVVRVMKDGDLSGGQVNQNGNIGARSGLLTWDKDWAYQHPEVHEFIYNPTSTSGIRIDYLNHTGEGQRTDVAEIKYNRPLSELKADGIHFRFWMDGVFSNYKTWDGTTPLANEAG